MGPPPACRLLRRARRAGAGVRRHRVRRVGHARGAVQPKGNPNQRVRLLLPRQLAVLRPEHLRPVPGRHRAADDGGDAVVAPAARRPAVRRRAGGAARGTVDHTVAVVAGGAAARAGRARRAALEREVDARGHGGARRGGRGSGAGAPRRLQGQLLDQSAGPDLDRPGDPGARGCRAVPRPAGGGLGVGELLEGVRAPGQGVAGRVGVGVAHDPADRRRRAGRARHPRLPSVASLRAGAAVPGGARFAAARSDRCRVRSATAPHLPLRVFPRGPGHVGAARGRHRPGAGGGTAHAPGRARAGRGAGARPGARDLGVKSFLATPEPGAARKDLTPIELAVVAAALVAATAFWALVPTYPSLDSYYALVWGREAFGGHTPSFDGYRAPTHHPLWVLVAGLLSLAGGDADRLLALVALWCLVLFLWGLYRLGARQFGAWVGLAAAAFAASSFAFLLYAVRAFVDIPFLAAVVWAAVLAIGERRRPVAAMTVLAVAGLLRPEAWLLAGLLWLWTVRGAAVRDRVWLSVLLLAAPAAWLVIDAAVTGDALFSFHAASALADELRHSGGAAQVPGALVSYLNGTIRAAVALLGLAGVALAWWRYGPRRIAVPLAVLLAGTLTFVVAGLAGFSLIQRYLTVPAAALCLFAGYALLGFTTLAPGDRIRRAWSRVAAVI